MTSLKDVFNWHNPTLFKEGSHLQKGVILIVLVIVNLFIGLESFGVTICDDLLRGYYHLNKDQTNWLNTMFLFGVSSATPLYIYVCARFSAKAAFCFGLITFVVSSFLSGLSFSYFLLLFFRLITGFSGGLASATSGIILQRLFENSSKAPALALSTVLFGSGFALAQVIGGAVGQSLHWRVLFFIDVFIVAIALVLILGALKERKEENPKNLNMDFRCYIYYILGLSGLTIFFTQVKAPWNTLGWRSDFSLINAALVFLFIGLFIKRCKNSSGPLFHTDVFKDPLIVLMGFTSFIMGLTIWSGTQVVFSLISSFQYEHITTGLVLSTFGLAIVFSGVVVFLLRHLNPFYFIIIGLIFIASSCFANHAVTLQSSLRDIVMVLVLRGLGVGMCLCPINQIVSQRARADIQQKCGVFIAATKVWGGGLVSPVISVVLVMREAYHDLRFGEQINIYSGAFKRYIRAFQLHAEVDVSENWAEAKHRAVGYVIQNTKTQSAVLSLNDAFFLLGWAIIVLIIALCMYELAEYRKKKRALTSQ